MTGGLLARWYRHLLFVILVFLLPPVYHSLLQMTPVLYLARRRRVPSCQVNRTTRTYTPCSSYVSRSI
jgi:hypothetical protein